MRRKPVAPCVRAPQDDGPWCCCIRLACRGHACVLPVWCLCAHFFGGPKSRKQRGAGNCLGQLRKMANPCRCHASKRRAGCDIAGTRKRNFSISVAVLGGLRSVKRHHSQRGHVGGRLIFRRPARATARWQSPFRAQCRESAPRAARRIDRSTPSGLGGTVRPHLRRISNSAIRRQASPQ